MNDETESYGDEGTLENALVIDNTTQKPIASPHKIRLNNASFIRQEMGRVYRKMIAGEYDIDFAGKAVWILERIGNAYKNEVLEQRLESIELAMKLRKNDEKAKKARR